jgi:hypothetical protein
MSGALHLGIFDQPEEIEFFRKLIEKRVAGLAVAFLSYGRTGVFDAYTRRARKV